MTPEERAEALFKEGYNCAQAVLGAFYDTLGLTREQALALMAPFGGGIGRTGETCGALIGLLTVYGAVSGGEDKQNKSAVSEKARSLIEAFRQEAGSVFCRELKVKDAPHGTPPCPDLVKLAARLAEQQLKEQS